jgi:hypothetical protein
MRLAEAMHTTSFLNSSRVPPGLLSRITCPFTTRFSRMKRYINLVVPPNNHLLRSEALVSSFQCRRTAVHCARMNAAVIPWVTAFSHCLIRPSPMLRTRMRCYCTASICARRGERRSIEPVDESSAEWPCD